MSVAPHTGLKQVNRTVTYITDSIKEVLTIHRGAASGGTWDLTIKGQTLTADWDETAGALETLVEALSTVTAATVTGDGTSGDPWIITIDDPIKSLPASADGSNLTPSDSLVFALTTSGSIPGRLKPAVITALGAGEAVDLRVGRGGEVYSDVPLMTASTDIDCWYGTSRRHF